LVDRGTNGPVERRARGNGEAGKEGEDCTGESKARSFDKERIDEEEELT
jgi:hypothetical protein